MAEEQTRRPVRVSTVRLIVLVLAAAALSVFVTWRILGLPLEDIGAIANAVGLSVAAAFCGANMGRRGLFPAIFLVLFSVVIGTIHAHQDRSAMWRIGWGLKLVGVPVACYIVGWLIDKRRSGQD